MRAAAAALCAALGDALLPTKVAGVWRKPALSGRRAAEAAKALLAAEAREGGGREAVTPPSTSYTAAAAPSSSTPPSTPAPFGFRRFKGHKHDREAAARREATAVALASMPDRIAEHRAARRAAVSGASPLDRLLSRPKELRLKAGRGVAPGPPKK